MLGVVSCVVLCVDEFGVVWLNDVLCVIVVAVLRDVGVT